MYYDEDEDILYDSLSKFKDNKALSIRSFYNNSSNNTLKDKECTDNFSLHDTRTKSVRTRGKGITNYTFICNSANTIRNKSKAIIVIYKLLEQHAFNTMKTFRNIEYDGSGFFYHNKMIKNNTAYKKAYCLKNKRFYSKKGFLNRYKTMFDEDPIKMRN